MQPTTACLRSNRAGRYHFTTLNPADLNGENVSMPVNRPPLGFRAERFVLIVEKRDQTCQAKALELVGNNPMSFEATVIRPQAAP